MKRIICAAALACCTLTLAPAGAEACPYPCAGDCNGDCMVAINELVTGVGIALGNATVAACMALDLNHDGHVMINELVAAVFAALNGCGPTLTLSGSCLEPGSGNQSLKPCDAGTPITIFRCDDPTQCLHQAGLAQLTQTTVVDAGAWSVQIPAAEASATLIFQASIAKAVVYRTLSFGMVGGSQTGVARALTFAPAPITPVTEAAVELLNMYGFENYSDSAAQQVLAVVQQELGNLSFADLTPAGAVMHALDQAENDPLVLMVLEMARNTPTPTPSATPTATRTPPRSLLLVADGNSDRVDVVNAATASIAEVHVGPGPRGVALTPDGTLALAANSGHPPGPSEPCPVELCPDTVSIIDIAARKVRATIPDFFTDAEDDPYYVAVTSDGQRAYITNNLSDSVSVVDLNQALVDPGTSLVARIPLGSGAAPVGIVAARKEPYVYVANSVAGTLGVIGRSTNEQIVAKQMPGNPALLALTSDDATLYVTAQSPNGGVVVVVDTALLRTPGEAPILKTILVGGRPSGIAISGDDQTVYVVNTGASTLQVISRTGDVPNKVVSTVPLLSGAQPIAVALSGDARVAYVTNSGQNSVTFVDTTLALSAPQNAIIRTVTVGSSPQGIVALEP